MITPRELKAKYDQGENLTAILRRETGNSRNSEDIIEWSYDIQAGSYIEALRNPEHAEYNKKYVAEIARLISSFGKPQSVIEAGVGEATTLGGVAQALGKAASVYYGFDISWSRIAFARRWLYLAGLPDVSLCTASLLHMPYATDSVDIVYTSHSIEPNGGQEESILRELYRVTRRYLILLEPGYELAGEKARNRMESHGYCRNLPGIAHSLGYNVIEHKLFPFTSNPLNPTALTIIEKKATTRAPDDPLVCPRFKTPLRKVGGMYFSPEALTVYPVIGGIPCLRLENGVIASHYLDLLEKEDL